jgi:hypothetical protein
MRIALFALVLGSGIAAADPPAAKPEPKQPTTCKKVVVGKGLDRHVVCQIEGPVVVATPLPKPGVIVVPNDGKKVTGRPKSGDRLNGLSHQLR